MTENLYVGRYVMLNQKEILSTIQMIDQQHLDIRTITMGISLLDDHADGI